MEDFDWKPKEFGVYFFRIESYWMNYFFVLQFTIKLGW